MTNKKPNSAVLGASGVVGREILGILAENNVEFNEIKFLASKRSAGNKIEFKDKEYTMSEATPDVFEGVNVVLASRLLWGHQSLVSYRELASQYAELLKERDAFDAVNAGLSREIRLLQSDEKYVEKMIRQRLNFVRSNEILYLFTEDANARGALPHDGKN